MGVTFHFRRRGGRAGGGGGWVVRVGWQKEGPLSGQPHAAGTGECLARLFLSEYVKAMKFMHHPDDDEISELLLDVLLAQLWGKCRAPDFPMSLLEPTERMISIPGLHSHFIRELEHLHGYGLEGVDDTFLDHIEFVKQFHDNVRTCKDLRLRCSLFKGKTLVCCRIHT